MPSRAKFNRDDVIDKAKDLYWEKGYHGTSMRALQEAIDMRPGSIYATFGSKDKLFSEALHRYAELGRERLQRCVAQSDTPLAGLKQFVHALIIDSRDSAPSAMCMIVKSVAELTESDNPELLAEAKTLLRRVESAIEQVLIDAKAQGELSEEQEPAELARYLQVQIIGLRTYARACDDRLLIENMIDAVFSQPPIRT
ncbi:TetR/AcrR family transcriptional regulator [Vibrio scophthalmi]|uniref:TetR/AcrR family transcriptional regulator n=1 Tax=Vibrio scophthalmi TaxID=45658 RepID=UPI002FF23134